MRAPFCLRDTARAMSQENVEVVRKAYQVWEPAWGSGTSDLVPLLALMDESLVCRSQRQQKKLKRSKS
jgi:hypothetical protein